MDDKVWTPAKLSAEQLDMVEETERTLGVPVNILALQPVGGKAASLNASQTECLQGLEKKLGMVLVALRK